MLQFQEMTCKVEDTAGMLSQHGMQLCPVFLVAAFHLLQGVIALRSRRLWLRLGTFLLVSPPLLQIYGTDWLRRYLRLFFGVGSKDKATQPFAHLTHAEGPIHRGCLDRDLARKNDSAGALLLKTQTDISQLFMQLRPGSRILDDAMPALLCNALGGFCASNAFN